VETGSLNGCVWVLMTSCLQIINGAGLCMLEFFDSFSVCISWHFIAQHSPWKGNHRHNLQFLFDKYDLQSDFFIWSPAL